MAGPLTVDRIRDLFRRMRVIEHNKRTNNVGLTTKYTHEFDGGWRTAVISDVHTTRPGSLAPFRPPHTAIDYKVIIEAPDGLRWAVTPEEWFKTEQEACEREAKMRESIPAFIAKRAFGM